MTFLVTEDAVTANDIGPDKESTRSIGEALKCTFVWTFGGIESSRSIGKCGERDTPSRVEGCDAKVSERREWRGKHLALHVRRRTRHDLTTVTYGRRSI